MTTTPTSDTAPDQDDHGFELKRNSKWVWIALALAIVIVGAVIVRYAFFNETKSANEIPGATLVVATNEGNAAEQALIEYIGKEVAPRHGIKVAFRGLSDSNTINRAVNDGEVAGTVYQHKLWLGQVLEANPDFRETAATPVFRWGFGIWSDKYTDVTQLPDGANVSLYSDPANEAQGLWLLERAGLITLKPGVDKWQATQKDIEGNPKHLKFTLLDFAAQSRSLPDLDAAVGYTEYYLAAKVPLTQQIFAPPAPDEFAGQLTIGTKWADTENIKKLVETFKDPAVQQFLATDPSVKNILLPL
ncbi:metal ABC transporter substrate-binding protein [Mycolicibacterium fluoranthenivorans]|jgi:ABC-type metal ion transport system substrate-binding protein|uniref:ABC-type metal ion transport system, substrate-binding protein/surface antigen n=1 Tax=Mycolicibacterium fluoranthenivorans TaxID=258505 RepID=A0A1G4WAN1_9MYCO|nr:MetQ/NlpA family ABC transporter substrate-binding protein [Mycolicibacterium fluoranthenivorans]QNJ90529.1 metal ABC transporter substrate-binding protein [Mycolicibacterium fluoranthenivorans]SCX19530.1 ABC-type metal ion transport system, substrate-binding protein/surface antigen [Mycolicibacterium fluoranthenivorans]